MKLFGLILCYLFLGKSAYASVKYVLMMSPESSREMPFRKIHSYCEHLDSKCEFKNSGKCDEQQYAKWVVPDKTDLDQFTDATKSAHFLWTSSRLFATGDMYPAVYRLSKGGAYAPSFGGHFRVRCVKWVAKESIKHS